MVSFLAGALPPQPIPYAFVLPGDEQHAYISWRLTRRLTSQFAGISQADMHKLQAAGWKKFNPETDTSALPYLESQFSEILEIAARETAKSQTWIRKEDLEFAQKYPVLIVTQGMIQNGKVVSDGGIPGSHALIMLGDGQYRVYTIDQLGDEALAAWDSIQQWHSPSPFRTTAIADIKDRDIKQLDEQLQIKWDIRSHGLQAIKELAVLYWEYHQKEQKKTKVIPPVLNLFQGTKHVDVPTSIAIRGILSAYSNAHSGATNWKQTGPIPSYTFQQTSDSALIELRPLQNIADLTRLLWNQVTQLSDFDGDVLLACMAQWMAEHDDTGATWITSEQILSYRGIQPRKYIDAQGIERPGTHRFEDLERIEESIEHIRNTHVSTQQWVAEERAPGQRGRPKKRLLRLQSYVFIISDFLEQKTFFEDDRSESLQIAWKFRPGACIEPFVHDTNRQVAQLFQQALAYDPYRELWEKRLARYFMLRLHRTTGEATSCQISDLFAELSLTIEKRNPDRMKQRFEQTLNRLLQDQIISSWQYQEDTHELPSKKWVETWLSYHVLVEASLAIRSVEERQKNLGSPRKRRKDRHSGS